MSTAAADALAQASGGVIAFGIPTSAPTTPVIDSFSSAVLVVTLNVTVDTSAGTTTNVYIYNRITGVFLEVVAVGGGVATWTAPDYGSYLAIAVSLKGGNYSLPSAPHSILLQSAAVATVEQYRVVGFREIPGATMRRKLMLERIEKPIRIDP